MTGNQFALLRSRRFLPLFVTQFLGALNDNFFKNAFVILLTYRLAQEAGLNGQVLVTAAAGLFILPFFLFSATAGFLADKFEKRRLILAVKIAEIGFMAGPLPLPLAPPAPRALGGPNETAVPVSLPPFAGALPLGSRLCNNLLAGAASPRLVPLGALGISLFPIDLYYASAAIPPAGALLGIGDFLGHLAGWRIVGDLVLIAISGGVFIVPLYTFLQARSEESHRSRIIAANNIWNALFIVVAAIATVVLLETGFTVPQGFLIVAIVNFVVALWICRLLPGTVAKSIAAALLRLVYRVELKGIENYRRAGKRAVIVVNHISFLDGPLLAVFLPGRPTFPVNTFIARKWWVRPIFWLVDAITIDPTNPMATKALIRAVQDDRKCVVFPEGRITITGALMKIYEGPGMIADKADAPVLPVRIDGAQYTPFSRLRGKLRLRLFPRITITILEPRRIAVDAALRGRKRRQAIGLQLYDIMTDLIFETNEVRQTLFEAMLDASRVHGRDRPVVEDIERRPLSYDRLIAGSFPLGRRLTALAPPGGRIGVVLPNSAALAVTFFGLQAIGRVPALLNF